MSIKPESAQESRSTWWAPSPTSDPATCQPVNISQCLALTLSPVARFAPKIPLPRCRDLQFCHAHLAVRLAFQAHPVPQLQIQQTPDAIIIVAMFRAMLSKQLFNRVAPEISTLQTARFQQHLANRLQARPGEPPAPRRRKSQLLPVENLVR